MDTEQYEEAVRDYEKIFKTDIFVLGWDVFDNNASYRLYLLCSPQRPHRKTYYFPNYNN